MNSADVARQIKAMQEDIDTLKQALIGHFKSDDDVQNRIAEDVHKVLMLLLNSRVDSANQNLQNASDTLGMPEDEL